MIREPVTSTINEIKSSIRQLLSAITKDMERYCDDEIYIDSYNRFTAISEKLLRSYKHHQGSSFAIKDASLRFRTETGLLSLFTEIIQEHLGRQGLEEGITLSPRTDKGFFGWYDLPDSFSDEILNISKLLLLIPNPELVLSEICGNVFSDADDSFIGEFYTPLHVVDHLIYLSGITPQDILNGKKIIDPACGAGIILLRLFALTAEYAKSNTRIDELICILSTNILGFDIQPFAVKITKTLLVYTSYLIFGKDVYPIDENTFSKIVLIDTLSTDTEYWSKSVGSENERGFEFIIGNPPYMSVKRADIPNIEAYKDVLFGHPNLYQLFIWWAIRSAKRNGKVCFLVPQSMISGNYYKNLRDKIHKHTKLIAITRFLRSKSISGHADIQVMAICLEVNKNLSITDHIKIRITQDGNDISTGSPIDVSELSVVNKWGSSHSAWIISGSHMDYDILGKVDHATTLIGSSLFWKIGNGNFVWNQNKEHIRKEYSHGCIPLVSATSIKKFYFEFPYLGSHQSKNRQFSIITPELDILKFCGPILLIQRTTPRKNGHRIVATITPKNFYEKYTHFFLENHVNYVSPNNSNFNLLYGLLGWINSDLFNYLFLIRNGTTSVSTKELKLLPVDFTNLESLATLTREILRCNPETRTVLVNELNQLVFENISLRSREVQHIKSALQWKEKALNEDG